MNSEEVKIFNYFFFSYLIYFLCCLQVFAKTPVTCILPGKIVVVPWEELGVDTVRNVLARDQVINKTNGLFGYLYNNMYTSLAEEFARLCPLGPGRGDTGSDLNECDFMPNACVDGECVNTDGSYRCECATGFVLDSSGKKCIGKLIYR
jgi:hypothetical protein